MHSGVRGLALGRGLREALPEHRETAVESFTGKGCQSPKLIQCGVVVRRGLERFLELGEGQVEFFVRGVDARYGDPAAGDVELLDRLRLPERLLVAAPGKARACR